MKKLHITRATYHRKLSIHVQNTIIHSLILKHNKIYICTYLVGGTVYGITPTVNFFTY